MRLRIRPWYFRGWLTFTFSGRCAWSWGANAELWIAWPEAFSEAFYEYKVLSTTIERHEPPALLRRDSMRNEEGSYAH